MKVHELSVEHLTYWYPERERPALCGINWQVSRGEFVLLAGPSGCGKSTLLRTLNGLVPEFYGGRIAGRVRARGQDLRDIKDRRIARHVGMVFQDPERQLVMNEVEREIAFGLENLAVPENEMRRRVAEVMAFFDLTPLRRKRTADLSGGEKQKVAIASVMALQPDVLLLDEPTSQLDPGAAQEILDLIKRMNEELGLTVVLVEQRLDRVLHLADRVAAMADGKIEFDGSAQDFAHYAAERRTELLLPVTKLFVEGGRPERPLTVKDARSHIAALYEGCAEREERAGDPPMSRMKKTLQRLFAGGGREADERAFEAGRVRFRYESGEEVLKGLDLIVPRGSFTAILGPNGAGKSTLLRHFCALLHPQEGKVLQDGRDLRSVDAAALAGRVGYLSQNPGDYLFHETLRAECEFSRRQIGLSTGDDEAERVIVAVLETLGLLPHLDRNPRDLSGGERQRAALATVLVQEPSALLLDEPTRGLDSGQKEILGNWLRHYVEEGRTVVLITHDVEFAAEHAGHLVLLDDGQTAAQGTPREMLARGLFYAPQIGRAFRGYEDDVVTLADGAARLRGRSGQVDA